VLQQMRSSIDNTLATAALLARPAPLNRIDMDIDTLVEVCIQDLGKPIRRVCASSATRPPARP
jgi:hypothetical protein